MAPPTGLRALHKADRSRRLLDTATRLFRDHGYDAVRIEDIAAEAQLSPGTVYNYFSTKGEILLAIVTLEVEEVLAQGQAVLAAPGPGFQEAMGALVGGYYDHSLHYLSKAMWRTAMAQTIATPDSAFSQHYLSLDRRLTDQICALLAQLQARGAVTGDIDPRRMGELIFNDINQMFTEFVRDEALPLTHLQQALAAHLHQLGRLVSPTRPRP